MKPSMSLKEIKEISSNRDDETMKLILALSENLESLIRQINLRYDKVSL